MDSCRQSIALPGTDASAQAWEEAYLRFETPEQEIRKFIRRLIKLSQASWRRDAQVVELFCGSGQGLHALHRLGFCNLDGVDLSAALLHQYHGPARCFVHDCRELPFDDCSRDIMIVQGGLHHLPAIPDDLERTLAEVARVLRPDGLFVAVEPWQTPFLSFVHAVCNNGLARRLWPRLDALATMIEHERTTYEQWLARPEVILAVVERYFNVQSRRIGWGKLMLKASPRRPVSARPGSG